MYNLENFGYTLAKLRKERGWTQSELAKKIGIAPQSISKWERCVGFPDVSLFPLIAEIFSVPVGILFGDAPKDEETRLGMEKEPDPHLCCDRKEFSGNSHQNGLLSYKNRKGSLLEFFENGEYYFELKYEEKTHTLPLYSVKPEAISENSFYCGYTKEEILASGRDLLAECLLKNGDPDYAEVKGALPPLSKDTYTVLGGVASVSGLTVDSNGKIYHQLSGRNRSTDSVFVPSEYDSVLGAIKPRQFLVGKEYPLLVSVHSDGSETLEFLYFVEPNEPDRDPICWIRIKRYKNDSPKAVSFEYRVAAISREADERELYNSKPSEALFLDALYDTLSFWITFAQNGARFDIPEAELSRVASGSISFAALTYTCGHAHYGHRFYGKELHDNFPPNYIHTLEALISVGRKEEAREVFSHFLKYVLRLDGKINYRQGTGLNFGASAAEYGMLLFLANKYREVLQIDKLTEREKDKLIGMGEEILEHFCECEELGGLKLIKMCAEADTNERVHVYINNNLWAVRGLYAIGNLFGGERFLSAANELLSNTERVLECFAVRNTHFGDLVPFRVGYTATPLTLSRCEETFYPLTTEQRNAYFGSTWDRGDKGTNEDLIENNYANYRYYPEMLSSMLLPEKYSDAIVGMRENVGGELLAMTRFLDRLDDWPVLNYARFLIETERIEKYLLLLYSHTAHHGEPERMSYYEQVAINGAVKANDCIPSLLTSATMLSWCFAYEGISENKLKLLSAIPRKWYNGGFSAKGIGYSGGAIDIEYSEGKLTVTFENIPTSPVEISIRAKKKILLQDIATGSEYVERIDGNVIFIKPGIKHFEITII